MKFLVGADNLLNPGPDDIYTPLPDEFMPDWYQERMKRINNPDNKIEDFEFWNE